jgi:hypothetical protein
MIPVGILTAAATSSFSFLLDQYPGAAVAYSTRKLRSAYSGACIRVRRSSDNAETDIGFVSNVLDTTTLSTFCGAGDGFITVWYDQSGNGRNINPIVPLSSQPKIVSSGVIQTVNSKPAILGDGIDDILLSTINPYVIPVLYSMFAVVFKGVQTSDASTTPRPFFAGGDGTTNGVPYLGTAYNGNALQNKYYVGIIGGGTIVNSVDWNNNVTILAYNKMNGGSGAVVGINGNSTTGTLANIEQPLNYVCVFGNYNIAARRFAGKIPELILYASDQTANRTGIESNINSFYTIF